LTYPNNFQTDVGHVMLAARRFTQPVWRPRTSGSFSVRPKLAMLDEPIFLAAFCLARVANPVLTCHISGEAVHPASMVPMDIRIVFWFIRGWQPRTSQFFWLRFALPGLPITYKCKLKFFLFLFCPGLSTPDRADLGNFVKVRFVGGGNPRWMKNNLYFSLIRGCQPRTNNLFFMFFYFFHPCFTSNWP